MPIICPDCSHILEGGSGPTIHKVCIHCIQNKYPGANIKKVKELHKEQKKITDMDVNSMISESEAKNLKKPTKAYIFALMETLMDDQLKKNAERNPKKANKTQ